MVHGGSRAEVMAKVGKIAGIIGSDCPAPDVLFSTRILKKTGLRIGAWGWRDNGGLVPNRVAGRLA
jgi:hypothetical protein